MNDNTPSPSATPNPPISSSAGNLPQDTLLQRGAFDPPFTPGTLGRLDKYEILRFLGEGSMGQVFLAREPVTGVPVAIKILHPRMACDPQAAHRFLVEARHMYGMNHPHILRVLDVSDRKEGPYYVMPYNEGGSLLTLCKPDQALPEDKLLPIAQQVAGALAYAHTRGIIHRDLKPGNVLLDKQGNALLSDFGLVRTVFNDSMVDPTASHLEGTAPYMSPAVAQGEAEDTRCDIYAFGAMLYQMLTGQLPYTGRTPQAILDQVLKGPPPPIGKVNPKANPALVKIAEGCMARELRDRYAAMTDVVADLDRVSKGKAPVGPRGQAGLGKSINLRRLAIPVTVALACVVLAVGLWQGAAWWSRAARTVSGWQATLERAAKAHDENRFEEAVGLFDAALAAMNADQTTDPSVLKMSRDKAGKDRALTRFILDRSKLPLPQQIELTQQKLAEFNTNYTGKGAFTVTKDGRIIAGLAATGITDLAPLKALPLSEVNLSGNMVEDLSPLRGMKLEVLGLWETPVGDLAPLKGMPLKSLVLFHNKKVVDLSPLKGMTSLTELNCDSSAGIRDVGPLQGLPLKSLRIGYTQVSDLVPLQGMPLEILDIRATSVRDLRPLRGMPLKELWFQYCPVIDLSPLRTLKALEDVGGIDPKPLLNDLYTALRTNGLAQAKQEAASLIADCRSVPAFSNVVAEAREIQTALAQLAQGDTGPYAQYWLKHLKERGVVGDKWFWYQCDTNGLISFNLEGFLVASNVTLEALHYVPLKEANLRGGTFTNLQALAGLPLTSLILQSNPVTDLSPLLGMKLQTLWLNGTPVTDLAPLKGMPLKYLNLQESKVIDLSPLKGMGSLTELNCGNTGLQDVGPLRGVPLKTLNISGTKVVDLSPLKGMTSLTDLSFVGTGIRDLGPLRGMPLKSLNLHGTKVSDLAPLQGMPLEWLSLSETPTGDLRPLKGLPLKFLGIVCPNVTDISPLQGMPLEQLYMSGTRVTDLSPLRTLKALAVLQGVDPKPLLNDLYTALRTNGLAQAKREADALIADCQSAPAFSNVVAEAREIQTALAQLAQGDTGPYAQYWLKHLKERGVVKHVEYEFQTNGLIYLSLNGSLVSSNATLDALHWMPFRMVSLQDNNLTNLQTLAGLPLTWLNLDRNPVADLSPLRGMKLEFLSIACAPVTDLTPLQNAPLTCLIISQTRVTDLGPLAGKTSLREINADGTPLSDLSPLKGMSLSRICIGWTKVRDLSPLKGMKSLTEIRSFDVAGLLLADLRRAVEAKDNTAVKTLAPKIIADWQDVPAMADVVKQAKEMLQAAGGAAAGKDP